MPRRRRGPKSPLQEALARRRRLVTRAGRLARSETLTVRLDPRLRYLAEIAARKQRRTVSSYVEWAIEKSLDQVQLANSPNSSVAAESLKLWDVNKAERFARLASHYPSLLNHEEQTLWTLIRGTPGVWDDGDLNLGLLHTYWDTFVAVARREADSSILPARPPNDARRG